jgi:hypothetical protein
MIVVKIEMWPKGDEAKKREIGRKSDALGSALDNKGISFYGPTSIKTIRFA